MQLDLLAFQLNSVWKNDGADLSIPSIDQYSAIPDQSTLLQLLFLIEGLEDKRVGFTKMLI